LLPTALAPNMGTFPSDRYFYGLILGGLVTFLVVLMAMMAMGWDVYTIAWISVANATLIGMALFMWVLIKAMYGTSNGSSS
jgi:cellulose synthase/poly-beta-1,6-N-acetylglucosamine synthase-like glycosyltransferase